MKELSDDIMTKRIREVLVQYEPDYSPQFWERIRKQRPLPELWLITLLQKYKFWLSVLTTVGVLFMAYFTSDVQPADKNSTADPLSPVSLYYPASEKDKEIISSDKTPASGNSYSYDGISRKENKLPSKVMPALMTDPLTVAYQNNNPSESANAGRTERIEKYTGDYVLPEGADFGFDLRTQHLIPIEYKSEGSQPLKGQANNKMGKLEFYWPDFKSLITNNEDYDKFVGPNKLAFFYSPEIHFSDSIKTIGLAQGIGVSFEGPIRSLISVSAGLSYQSINFDDKTVFSGKVPPHGPFQPPDTNRTFYMIDSIEIRSGSYKFLELPVSLNFKFLETTKSEVWLGTGISAIAFLRQEYTYETLLEEVSESSSISVKAWENIYPLASLNFSLLYRYNLSYRSLIHGSVQYKQHLVPMGYNSMKLNRLTLQVGIIYLFGRED